MKSTIVVILITLSGAVLGQANMTKVGELSYAVTLSDVWGHVDTAGNEYALVGLYDAVSIVELDTPSAPKELFRFSGPQSTWRDIMDYQGYAYCSNEQDSGILIMDLRFLPDSASAWRFDGGGLFSTAHNLWVDDNGYLYLFGADFGVGGAMIFSLADPANPVYITSYNTHYVHDGFVRGDTFWSAEVNDGIFSVIDVSDTANIGVMATNSTPNNFTHNVWPSDNNDLLFTTDEKSDAYIASYDVSDLANITELDRYRSSHSAGVIPHNTHFLDNYLITSYYSDGITVVDAQNPDNLIETGYFDTSPFFTGAGFNGAWGVYPYLPSGNILASDVQEGLIVLSSNYTRAAYLHGNVTDAVSLGPLNGVEVNILTTTNGDITGLTGDYKTGHHVAGNYSVVYSKVGYFSDTVTNVLLQNDSTTIVDVALIPKVPFNLTLSVIDSFNLAPIPNAMLRIVGFDATYDLQADMNGQININPFFQGDYSVFAGIWGYITNGFEDKLIDSINGQNLIVKLAPGYYDDFTLEFQWQKSGSSTVGGEWERAIPEGTGIPGSVIFNPDKDVDNDWADLAYVTGNGGLFDFVGGGTVTLQSPTFDLTTYTQPYVNYYTWFANLDSTGALADDNLRITMTNGSSTKQLENIVADTSIMSRWQFKSFNVDSIMTPTNNMKLNVAASADLSFQQLLECGFDKFFVTEGPVGIATVERGQLSIYPNPTAGMVLVPGKWGAASIQVIDMLGRMHAVGVSRTPGALLLDLAPLASGQYIITIASSSGVYSGRVSVQ